jgi:hypothetical protein
MFGNMFVTKLKFKETSVQINLLKHKGRILEAPTSCKYLLHLGSMHMCYYGKDNCLEFEGKIRVPSQTRVWSGF